MQFTKGFTGKVRPVLRMGNPELLRRSAEVPRSAFGSATLKQLVADMLATMEATNGAGIAAIQIGVPLRVFAFGITHNPRYPDALPIPTTILVNPVVTAVRPADTCEFMEGCLSVPGLRGPVVRPKAVRYSAFAPDGTELAEKAVDGFHARVVQHELDHLDGVLFPHRVTDFTRFGFTEEIEAAGFLPGGVKNVAGDKAKSKKPASQPTAGKKAVKKAAPKASAKQAKKK
jgi:peptide deformylase